MGINSKSLSSFKLITVTALCTGLLIPGVSNGVSVKESSLSPDAWLRQTDRIRVVLDNQVTSNEGELRFILNKTDLTSLFRQRKPLEYEYDSDVYPLPEGTTELVVYLVDLQGQWQEIARFPVQVKTKMGFKESAINPNINLNIKSELDNRYTGNSVAPARQKETDMTTRIGLNSSSSDDDFQLATNFNLLGVSHIQEALRYSEKGLDAEKLDLSDYIIELKKGNYDFSMGHISYGNNRYLLSNMGSRGLSYRGQLGAGKSFDFSLATMNGTNIVGYNNITGLSSNDHRISATTLGYEFNNRRPGALRAEIMYMDASKQSVNNFDAGEVPDAETSRGVGLKLTGVNESGSLQGMLTWARSNYLNPNDPKLSQGSAIVEVTESKDDARYAELSYEFYRSEPDEHGRTYKVAANVSHEYVDPLYKSLGAFAGADTQTSKLGFSFQLGSINLQLNSLRSEDNVDDVSTILKTKTDTDSVSLLIPLKQLFSEQSKQNNWLPDLQVQYNQVHQYGENLPPTFDPATHIPDQLSTNKTLGLNWSAEKISFSYNYSVSRQDNRQPGRALADFRNENHGVSISYRFNDALDITLGITKVDALDVENNLINYDDNYSFGFNWRMTEKLGLSANYSEATGTNSQLTSGRDGVTGQAQLNWQFELPGLSGKKVPGQIFINYAMQDNRNFDNVFNVQNNAKSWTLNAGLNISLF